MVDVGDKLETQRIAVATACIVMKPETLTMVRSNSLRKGDIFGVARIAGIMSAKNTSDLIPLCHPIPIDQVKVDFELKDHDNAVIITAVSKTTAKTGVEMEAMMAVSVAALTIYDMCKSVDRSMRIENIRLVSKSGGESGDIIL
jgi:cyclic pyranopterin phosphate synthase